MLDVFGRLWNKGVVKSKPKMKRGKDPGAPVAKKGGRPPSTRAVEYCWYGEIEGFDTAGKDGTHWWESPEYIDWDKELAAKKSERSGSRGELVESVKLPGFLWEVLRRTPEVKRLVDALSGLHVAGGEADGIGEGDAIARLNASTLLWGTVGPEVAEAMEVLRKHWLSSFDHLDAESMARWKARYLALWHHVGKPKTVPATPVAVPGGKAPAYYGGQWRTALNLLRAAESGEEEVGTRALQPVPGMFLQKFTKLRPPAQTLVERMDPLSKELPGKTNPNTYPWVSMGILTKRLGRNNMHPLLLAVDLSRTTESIIRDLKHIVDMERKSLGVCITDRRVKRESFQNIAELDKQVKNNDGHPPLANVIKAFEGSAQLDLTNLVKTVEGFAVRAESTGGDAEVHIRECLKLAGDRPLGKNGRRS